MQFFSKWKQVSETASAATLPTQGGWHYRSVKKSSDSPEVHPPSSVTIATGTVASTPPWLKVDNSPVQVSPAAAPSPLFESPAGTRTSRRHTVDVVSAPSPVVSAPNAALSAEDQTDKHFVGESSAAAQRRARQNTFFQTQVCVDERPAWMLSRLLRYSFMIAAAESHKNVYEGLFSRSSSR